MKTPMQQHMEWLHKKYISHLQDEETGLALEVWYCLKNAEQMLEKEKEMLAGVWLDAQVAHQGGAYIKPSDPTFDEYYDKTFNTKEK